MSQRDALVCLVDCNQTMFDTTAGEAPFSIVCQCVIETCKAKIMSSPMDMLAVVLYGTRDRKGDFDGIYVLQDLDVPSVELIKSMEALRKHYPHGHWDDSEEFPLSDAFWTASSLLAKTKVPTRRVFLFTNQDKPHDDRSEQLDQARRRLEDFHASNVEVELLAFDPPGREFRLGFYREVWERSRAFDLGGGGGGGGGGDQRPSVQSTPVYSSSQGSAQQQQQDVVRRDPMWKAASRLEYMLQRVRAKATPRRALTTLPMTLVPGVDLALKVCLAGGALLSAQPDPQVYMVAREAGARGLFPPLLRAFACCALSWVPAAEAPKFVYLDPESTMPMKIETAWICQVPSFPLRQNSGSLTALRRTRGRSCARHRSRAICRTAEPKWC